MPYINSSGNNFSINMLSQNGVVIIIDSVILLNHDTVMGENSTLIFQGGSIECSDNENGYKWRDAEISLFQPSNSTITALHIINKTVECYASTNNVDRGDWDINDKFLILGNDNKYNVKLPQIM